jgi:hypothetical protein
VFSACVAAVWTLVSVPKWCPFKFFIFGNMKKSQGTKSPCNMVSVDSTLASQ